ncbi:hypothetical protein TI03_04285, partial [Achromatium sp. WMS1]
QAAANLANVWHWHDQAIITLARSDFWDDLDLRFPLKHLKLVKQAAQDNTIAPAWIFAIMRQESIFAQDAVSPAGARGLMQLMWPTAQQVAGEIGLPLPDTTALLDPSVNIKLGSHYLNKVLQRFDNNIVLATAAYNAGPNRVNRWLPKRTMEAEIWVENIPFKETRTYVQRVMAYILLYRLRLGLKPGSIVERMSPIRSSQATQTTTKTK